MILLAVITAGLCLFSPLTLIVLPTLAWRFLSELPVYWGQEWQYSAVLMPVVFAAAIDALCRRKVLNSARLRLLLGTAILLGIGGADQPIRLRQARRHWQELPAHHGRIFT